MQKRPFQWIASLLLIDFIGFPLASHARHPTSAADSHPTVANVQSYAKHPHLADFSTPKGYYPTPQDPPTNGEIDHFCHRPLGHIGPPNQTFSYFPTIEQDWKNCQHLQNHDLRGAEADLGRDPDKVNQVFGVLPGGARGGNGSCAPGHEVPTSPLGIKALTHFKCEPIPGEGQRGDVAPFDATGADVLIPLDGTLLAAPQDQQRQGPPAPIERRRPSQTQQGPTN